MCEFCTKHGEGKTWYLNAKNYSDALLDDIRRKRVIKDFFYWVDRSYKRYFNFLSLLPLEAPVIGLPLKAVIRRAFIYKHWGQVIPIEDIERVLNITNSIVRIPCVCRKSTTGKEARVCFLISMNPGKMGMADIVDQSFFGGPDVAKFEKIEKKVALDFMKERELRGAFHSIWAHGTPYISGICNCDNTGCIPLKMYEKVTPIFFRAEYVIRLDRDACIGCKACIKICPFNALEYDSATKKNRPDYEKCYGCGICRTVCKKNALTLINRRDNIRAAKLWY